MTDLIECLSALDSGDITFLLETLSNNPDADSEFYESLLEPFFDYDSTKVLRVLSVISAEKIREASEIFSVRSRTPPPPADNESPALSIFSTSKRTTIAGAQNRAISLRQLRQVVAYIESHALEDGSLPWTDRYEESPTYNNRLHVDSINLYHVIDWVVKPITRNSSCSLVEMVAKSEQKPRWFISHAWAEPVKNFVAAVTQHAEVRGLSEDDYYWVCGYANNQHKIEDDIPDDPKKSSFYMAMQQSEGVLLCLDKLATPFKRIWCCFEEAMIVEGETLLLDIATVVDKNAVVLTDGFVDKDTRDGEEYALENKRERESGFPLELLEKGYQIDIRNAESCHQADKRRILNTIAGNVPPSELDVKEPDLTEEAFTRVNKKLRSIFAEAASRKAAEAGRIGSVIQILHEDSYREKLTLNLGGCNSFYLESLRDLSGHPSLQELTINVSYSDIRDAAAISNALIGMTQLKKLDLRFEWCRALENIASLLKVLLSLSNLTYLKLNFRCCALSASLPAIGKMQTLEHLYIDYSFTRTLPGRKTMSHILQLKNLRVLALRFKGCQDHFTHLGSFQGLEKLSNLADLRLDFSYTSLKDAAALSLLNGLKKLTRCILNFQKCIQLESVSWLLEATRHIDEVDINLSECKQLDSNLQASFSNWRDIATAMGDSLGSFLVTEYEPDEEVEYFSAREKCWVAAVVRNIVQDEIIVRFPQPLRGTIYTRRFPVIEASTRLRRPNSNIRYYRTGSLMSSSSSTLSSGSLKASIKADSARKARRNRKSMLRASSHL